MGLKKEESSEVTKFAVDTQLFKVVRMKADCEELHKDVKRLCDWAIKQQMKFSVDKCEVMHVGKNNPSFTYKMIGSKLSVATQE